MMILDNLINLVDSKHANNALVLNAMAKSYSKTPRTDAVQLIIDALFCDRNFDRTIYELREKLIYLLKKLVNGHRFKKKHFEDLYSKAMQGKGLVLSESKDEIKTEDEVVQRTIDQVEGELDEVKANDTPRDSDYYFERILTTIKVVETMLTNENMFLGPQNFIYFNGYKSGISMTKNSFTKAFCMSIWFRLEEMETGQHCPLLYSFHKEGLGGFECYFVDNQLYYRSLEAKYTDATENSKGVLIGVFDLDVWNFLSIRHEKKYLGRSELKVIINDKKAFGISMEFPKVDKIDKFSHGYIARHFCGQVSTCILFNENVSTDKLRKIAQVYPYGLYKKEHLNNLNTCEVFNAKLLSKIMLLYTPVRATPNVGVWDLIGNNFGSLETNSGVWCSEDHQDQLLYSGSLNGLLPICNLIKNRIEKQEHGVLLLQKYLEVVSLSVQSISGQPEMKNRFIRALFFLLEKVPRDFFHIKTIQQLAEIRFMLPQESNSVFFLCLVRSADIWVNCSTSIQKEFWAFVSDIYLQDPEYFHDIFGIPELIDYTLKLSEIKQAMATSTPKLSRSSSKEIREDASMQDLALILGVVEKLFIKGSEGISQHIKYLKPALSSKASASFKFEILKLLKVLLVDTDEDSQCPSPLTFAEHFIDNQGMHILLYLCTNSPLNVTSMCLKLIDVLSSLKKSIKKLAIDTDVIPFLSSIIVSKIKEKPALYTPSGKSGK